MTLPIDKACMEVLRIDLERFIKILRIELEHLERHILLLIDAYQDPHRSDGSAFTEHVRQGNLAVLQNERCGFKIFSEVLDRFDVADFETLEDLTDALKSAFEARLKEAGLARASYLFAVRKIEKVARYVQGSM